MGEPAKPANFIIPKIRLNIPSFELLSNLTFACYCTTSCHFGGCYERNHIQRSAAFT